MNGAQDLGGMMGFGPVVVDPSHPEPETPVFHSEWERRVFALTLAMSPVGRWNIDQSRFARESLPPARYLASSYYEIWLAGLERLMHERDLLTLEDLDRGAPAAPASAHPGRVAPADIAAVLRRGGPTARTPAQAPAPAPAYAIGQRVIARVMNPRGHTRLPRYVRGRAGVVIAQHGFHVFPDANAAGNGEAPQPLYTVRFAARDLWGADADPNSSVTVDAWESYLEPAP
ncbi:nitrile hydratase subunit beta [bacterium]|nr:nitrile hydratase subunit beta [bacterium]